jgi:hypothetical protein
MTQYPPIKNSYPPPSIVLPLLARALPISPELGPIVPPQNLQRGMIDSPSIPQKRLETVRHCIQILSNRDCHKSVGSIAP